MTSIPQRRTALDWGLACVLMVQFLQIEGSTFMPLECEMLTVHDCAFAVGLGRFRCVLESAAHLDGYVTYGCQTLRLEMQMRVGADPSYDTPAGLGGARYWSCLNLDTSSPRHQLCILLQQPMTRYRSRATVHKFGEANKSIAWSVKKRPPDQSRPRRLALINNNFATSHSLDFSTTSSSEKESDSAAIQAQDWIHVNTTTVCKRVPNLSSTLAASFSQIMLYRRSFSHQTTHTQKSSSSTKSANKLKLAPSGWKCNSRVMIRRFGSETAASWTDLLKSELPTTPLDTFSGNFKTWVPLRGTMHGRNRSPWLLQILEAVESELRRVLSCDESYESSTTGVTVHDWMGRGRRRLRAKYWEPLIIVNTLIGGLGLLLGVSALSWCVWRQGGCSFQPSGSDGFELPATAPRPLSAVSGGDDLGRASPARTPDIGDDPGRESLGRTAGRGDDTPGRVSLRRTPEIGDGPGSESLGKTPGIGDDRGRASAGRTSATGGDPGRESPGRRSPAMEEGRARASSVRSPAAEGGRPRAGLPQDSEESQRIRTERSQMLKNAQHRAEPFFLEWLARATEGFHEKNKLGAGSFGTVYRGLLFDGRVVAIKRADRSNVQKVGEKQSAFESELGVMTRLHHKHLVNLVGYCDDQDERILVYEYMPNGSLSEHLHNKRRPSRALSSWKVRIRVALQAARGIEYLHSYAVPPVIHRDIKASNILFDVNWSVRVSDFGLSLLFPTSTPEQVEGAITSHDNRHVSTRIAGTMGYIDPEYFRTQHLTTKSDVYSFGIVILELLTGKRAIHRRNNAHISVVEYAMASIDANKLENIMDPRMRAPTSDERAAMKVMAEVGRQCVRLRGADRPNMTEIIRRLEDAVTLCRPRNAPLPVFGAQLGSTPEVSAQSSHPSPRAPRPHGKSAIGLEADVEGEGKGSVGTDVAQLGSPSNSPLNEFRILQEFLHDVVESDDDNDHDDGFRTFSDVQSHHSEPGEGLPSVESAGASAYDGLGAVPTHVGPESSPAASASYGTGSRSQQASRYPSWPQQLIESWWRSTSALDPTLAAGSSSNFDDPAPWPGAYSGEGSAAAAATVPRDYDYSGWVTDHPVLQESPTLAGFANFGDVGPPEDVELEPPPPPAAPSQPKHVSRPAVRARGARVSDLERLVGYLEEPRPAAASQPDYVSRPVRGAGVLERLVGYLEEPRPAPAATAARSRGRPQRSSTRTETESESYIGDIDIEEFLVQAYSDVEQSTSHAGYSVHQDLEDLMRALQGMQLEQEQQEEQEDP